MTTQELIDELQATLGNRQDITDERYVQWLNWAQYDLCGFHRKRLFPSIRFRALEGKFIMNIPVISGTAQAGGADNAIILAAGTTGADDWFVDCVVELTDYTGTAPDGLLNQKRMVVDYDSGSLTITVDEDWDVNPDASTTYSIYRREFDLLTFTSLDPTDELWAVEKMETIRGTGLDKVDWDELTGLDGTNALSATPEKFARYENSLMFDYWINEALSLRAFYYRYPTQLDAGAPDVEPIIPEAWHEVILLGAIWRGHEKLMEPDRADVAKAQYIDAAINRLSQYDIEEKSIERGLKARSYNVRL